MVNGTNAHAQKHDKYIDAGEVEREMAGSIRSGWDSILWKYTVHVVDIMHHWLTIDQVVVWTGAQPWKPQVEFSYYNLLCGS